MQAYACILRLGLSCDSTRRGLCSEPHTAPTARSTNQNLPCHTLGPGDRLPVLPRCCSCCLLCSESQASPPPLETLNLSNGVCRSGESQSNCLLQSLQVRAPPGDPPWVRFFSDNIIFKYRVDITFDSTFVVLLHSSPVLLLCGSIETSHMDQLARANLGLTA